MAEHIRLKVETSSAVGSGIAVLNTSMSVFVSGVRYAPGGFGVLGGAGVTVLQGVGELCSDNSV